jgi:hypothetical protein
MITLPNPSKETLFSRWSRNGVSTGKIEAGREKKDFLTRKSAKRKYK